MVEAHDVRRPHLLASDGLTRELTDTDIAQILTQSLTLPHRQHLRSKHLQAKHLPTHGGRDNILLIACP